MSTVLCLCNLLSNLSFYFLRSEVNTVFATALCALSANVFLCFVFKSRPIYEVENFFNEVGVCQKLVCQKREFAVRSSSCEV